MSDVTPVTIVPLMHVALYQPDIPFNTGNIARTCLALHCRLHLIGKLGFSLEDRYLKRAGLDYFEHVDLHRHETLEACFAAVGDVPIHYFSAHAKQSYFDASFEPGCLLVFGSETSGLPAQYLADAERCWTIPMPNPQVRCLNLSTSAGIVMYEAYRQFGQSSR